MEGNITETTLDIFTHKALKKYTRQTVMDRALPDFKDGLKPVQRKILWSMYKMGLFHNLAYKKSARVSGDVMAKYSPHGDCYPAIVNLAQAYRKYNLVLGQGNWGSWSGDPAAASRYTEVKLSEFSDVVLLDKDYLAVVPYEDNYDGSEKEPVYLPARLPVCLMGNIQGIAMAVRTGLPCFSIDSLINVCSYYLKNKDLPENLEEILQFENIYGGKCISTKEEIKNFIDTGSGSITFEPDYELFKDRIEITGIQDNFDFEKVTANLEELSEVKSVKDEGDSQIKICIYLNCKSSDKKALDKIFKKLQTKVLYNVNILNRLWKDEEVEANYRETNIRKLIMNWCKFRVKLERDHLSYLISELNKDISYQQLLLKAAENVKEIFKALQEQDTKDIIMDKLKINSDQAEIILNLPIKRLSRLDLEKTKITLDNFYKQLDNLNKKLNNVVKVVIEDLDFLKGKFSNGKRRG